MNASQSTVSCPGVSSITTLRAISSLPQHIVHHERRWRTAQRAEVDVLHLASRPIVDLYSAGVARTMGVTQPPFCCPLQELRLWWVTLGFLPRAPGHDEDSRPMPAFL